MLIFLLKILFCLLLTSHTIRWVSYHIRHWNKKIKIYHGNTRMPFDVEFALMYGLHAKRKKRVKDLSYRRNLAEWKELLDSIYPTDNLNFTHQPYSNLVTPKSPKEDFSLWYIEGDNQNLFPFSQLKNKNPDSINNTSTSQTQTDLKSPLGDLGVKKVNNYFAATHIPLLFSRRGQSFARSRGGYFNLKNNKQIILQRPSNFLKISQNTYPFPKNEFACTCIIFTIWFHFHFLSTITIRKKTFDF